MHCRTARNQGRAAGFGEFADSARLVALGSRPFIRFGATRGLQIMQEHGWVAKAVLAADLALLADPEAQLEAATAELTWLVPLSPFKPLLIA